MIDPSFIRYAEEVCRERNIENDKIRKYRQKNWPSRKNGKLNEYQKKYRQSEKGKITSTKRNSIRAKRYRLLIKELTFEDLENIRNFYVNCPKGYEVDHIQPISKGGKHILSNLQYLTREENRRKGNSW